MPGCGSRSMRSSSGRSGSRPARRPRVKVDGSQARGPRHRPHLGDAKLIRHGARSGNRPGRSRSTAARLRHPLLVDRLALGAARVSLQRAGALVERPDDALSHLHVVVDKVDLATAPIRQITEVDLVGVGHAHHVLACPHLGDGRRHLTSRGAGSQEHDRHAVIEEAPSAGRPAMPHRFFRDEQFDFEIKIALGGVYYGCGDVGEILATAENDPRRSR